MLFRRYRRIKIYDFKSLINILKKMKDNSFSVWIGNGGTMKIPNKNVFTGEKNECEIFLNNIVEKKRKRGIKLHHHTNNGMMIKSLYFYVFISKNK